MTGTTTLPLPPGISGLIGLAALILLIYGALTLASRDRPGPLWGGLSAGWLALAVVGALAWTGLLALVLVAAIAGTLGMIADPASAGLGLGGLLVALLGAPFLIWTTVLKDRTVRFQKEGHMTDRISKAVEQLGVEKTVKKVVEGQTVETSEPNLEVRIGAILSLERIAQDSTDHDKGRDHVRVMEILCAYIRENSNARKPIDCGRDTDREEFKLNLTRLCPRIDVTIALAVIARRSVNQRLIEGSTRPEELQSGADALTRSRQRRKSGGGYRLDLRGSNFQGFNLSTQRDDGSDAVFSSARLDRCRFEGAELRGVQIDGANLWEAKFQFACLWDANLKGSEAIRVDFTKADLCSADLSDSVLERCRIECTVFNNETNWEGAKLLGSAVRNVDFAESNIQDGQLGECFGDTSVKLKDRVRPGHWPTESLDTSTFDCELGKWRATYTPPPPPPLIPPFPFPPRWLRVAP